MSSRKPLNGTPIQGDGLPFETADQFGEWWRAHQRELFGIAAKEGVTEIIAEPIVENLVLEILGSKLWARYDPRSSKAITYFGNLLKFRIMDYNERPRLDINYSFDVYQAGVDQHTDEGKAAERTLAEIDGLDEPTRLERASKKLREELTKLPPLEQEVLVLTMDGFSEKEIMLKLNLSDRNRVAYLKRSGLKKLRSNADLFALNPYADDN